MTPSREPGRDRPRREHCRLRTIVLLVMCAGHLTAAAESAPLVDIHPPVMALYPGEYRALDVPFTTPLRTQLPTH